MRALRLPWLVCVLTCLLVVPTFAQPNGQRAIVSKTFALTLYGAIPPLQQFAVEYGPTPGDAIVLCRDPHLSLIPTPELAACEGNGTVYTHTIDLPAGTALDVRWTRSYSVCPDVPAGGDPQNPAACFRSEVFHASSETISDDVTNSVYYRFGPTTDQQRPGTLPATGSMPATHPWGLIIFIVTIVTGLTFRCSRRGV